MNRAQRVEAFRKLLRQRILVLDGAMGTMIQATALMKRVSRRAIPRLAL